MTIQDLAGNPLHTQSSPMLGFAPVDLSTTRRRELSLRMYKFLIEGIREEDQTIGERFVERFLEGPQAVWGQIDRSIRSLPDMWSVTKCEDRFLPYLKWIVGWTSVYDYITDDLDAATLRRLIAASVPFWQIRGVEEALVDILRLTTAARLRTWNWFDLRWIAGETAFGEEHQGYDPWMLSLPGAPDYDENRMNLRIVDDGTLNRRLVRNLAKLTRPSGERITINYLGFLDLFETDDDASQWDDEVDATTSPVVASGKMTIASDSAVFANANGADSWTNYVLSVRLRGETPAVLAYRTGEGDAYAFQWPSNQFQVVALLAGTPSVLVQTDLSALGLVLDPSLFYTLRVELLPEGGSNRIRAWIDGNLVVSLLDSTHAQGGIGLSGLLSGSAMEVDDVEMFFNPLAEDIVDINS